MPKPTPGAHAPLLQPHTPKHTSRPDAVTSADAIAHQLQTLQRRQAHEAAARAQNERDYLDIKSEWARFAARRDGVTRARKAKAQQLERECRAAHEARREAEAAASAAVRAQEAADAEYWPFEKGSGSSVKVPTRSEFRAELGAQIAEQRALQRPTRQQVSDASGESFGLRKAELSARLHAVRNERRQLVVREKSLVAMGLGR